MHVLDFKSVNTFILSIELIEQKLSIYVYMYETHLSIYTGAYVKHVLKTPLLKKALTDIKYCILCILCKDFLNNPKTSTSQN